MTWYLAVVGAVVAVLMLIGARHAIHIFQLETYHYRGYLLWHVRGAVEKWLFSLLLAAAPAQLLYFGLPYLTGSWNVVAAVAVRHILPTLVYAGFMLTYILRYNKTEFKKKLVFTARIKRLYAALAIVIVAVEAGLCLLGMPFTGAVLLPLWVLTAALLVNPVEIAIRRYYVSKAHNKLMASRCRRIGITGSYGKTSTKFILATILGVRYKVLCTPASYNTPNGISRCVNDKLDDSYDIFIAEMGAAHKGDIAELCRIVRPQYGILTSVGAQHLETFGSQEAITETKYALVKALPADGAAFLNGENEICRELAARKAAAPVRLYAREGDESPVTVADASTDAQGSRFTLVFRHTGMRVACRTRLLGSHNILNIVGCAALALELGLTPEEIARGVALLEPTEHRLQLIPGAVTVIDDAFNSNPGGALEALRTLACFPGKKLIVTPGMVELGAEQEALNRRFGEQIAAYADLAILVGSPARVAPLIAGATSGGMKEGERVFAVRTFNDATAKMQTLITAGDTVLFENDLPDNYD
ncbi:MAG: UDP-N-acetylmuramoyl-tripeptide--D-alanyl-D-alanine ligase [Eubacteriales bacterium]|nr:UDP-N-acetylmuramoyl-tripeptide--D-alanyl-D-alanine ligase [Eubacteriales bacterium]